MAILWRQLVRLTEELKVSLLELFQQRKSRFSAQLRQLRPLLEAGLNQPLDDQELAGLCAQSVVCGTATIASQAHLPWPIATTALSSPAGPWSFPILQLCLQAACITRAAPKSSLGKLVERLAQINRWIAPRTSPIDNHRPHFCYETYLRHYDRATRRQRGVFYTPAPLAASIVQATDYYLEHEFHLADGLADTTTWFEREQASSAERSTTAAGRPFVQILDPAAGSGVFLVEIIDRIHRRMHDKWERFDSDGRKRSHLWNRYVSADLLPRLWGLEMMSPAAVVAQLRVCAKLLETGYLFQSPEPLHIYVADTLADPLNVTSVNGSAASCACNNALADLHQVRTSGAATVILGNPPYSGISLNHGRWIDRLLRGKEWGQSEQSYYSVDGAKLRERKHWLQDDYVKFFRYAQWRIEQSGCGVLAFISNHGYLDNATFRGMRQSLIRSFSKATIVNLQGSRKRSLTAAGCGADENVFAVEQGLAVGFFRRITPDIGSSVIEHAELRGPREEKLKALGGWASSPHNRRNLSLKKVAPRSPGYLLVPAPQHDHPEYRCAVRLPELMPFSCTAPVTARDHFLIGFDDPELIGRLEQFRDLSIPDESLRERFFTRTRSTRYPAGDTRGWKLSEARRRMQQQVDWQRHLCRCQYRPLDYRRIYFADWMIDWPRPQLMQHLLAQPNLALITRRQMLPQESCDFFWSTREIVLDGVIRSDNRGSESLFPVYVLQGKQPDAEERSSCRANFADAHITSLAKRLGLTWQPSGTGDLSSRFGPEDLLHYIYALFHAPGYRQRYASALWSDYPRVLLPSGAEMFRHLSLLGSQLIKWHTEIPAVLEETVSFESVQQPPVVGPRYPLFRDGRVYLNEHAWFDGVPQDVWEFRIGAHQVCRKWLRDRRGRSLGSGELQHYRYILVTVRRTRELMQAIEQAVMAQGGWSRAFVTQAIR